MADTLESLYKELGDALYKGDTVGVERINRAISRLPNVKGAKAENDKQAKDDLAKRQGHIKSLAKSLHDGLLNPLTKEGKPLTDAQVAARMRQLVADIQEAQVMGALSITYRFDTLDIAYVSAEVQFPKAKGHKAGNGTGGVRGWAKDGKVTTLEDAFSACASSTQKADLLKLEIGEDAKNKTYALKKATVEKAGWVHVTEPATTPHVAPGANPKA